MYVQMSCISKFYKNNTLSNCKTFSHMLKTIFMFILLEEVVNNVNNKVGGGKKCPKLEMPIPE